MIIKGQVLLQCPKTGSEVTLLKDCVDPEQTGKPCEFFKHLGVMGGFVPTIACDFDAYQRYQRDLNAQAKEVKESGFKPEATMS